MQDVVSSPSRVGPGSARWLSKVAGRIRSAAPSLTDCGVAVISAALLIFSFPDFDLWPLAWLGLVPLFLVIATSPAPTRAFMLGWICGAIFFYGSCHWLSYSMIHFGRLSPWLAYVLLLPGAALLGIFPGVFAIMLAQAIRSWGLGSLFLAALFWPALEWSRFEITGQLWNAIGYSQAYHPTLIQTAAWGGVYAVGFLIVLVNAAIAFAILKHNSSALLTSLTAISLVAIIVFLTNKAWTSSNVDTHPEAVVVAIQPNVPMDLVKSNDDMRMLSSRHFEMSEAALRNLPADGKPRLLIWPESPMNFTYGGDSQLRDLLAAFATTHKTSVLINSQEVAPNDGLYNSALLINEHGILAAQYDKIRLLPFGEYVPLPDWLPGAGLIRGIVGDFTPGTNYRLMPVGEARAGVFICIESAYPSLVRRFTADGADVLINISNDGYLGPTAVMRQHLANAVFRAVENSRPLLRVTNTGITALITPTGQVKDATPGFQPEVRTWGVSRAAGRASFYAGHGDLFVGVCAFLSLLVFGFSFKRRGTDRKA